jgi:hypothetical protein
VATWGAFTQPCTLCVVGSYAGGGQQLKVEGGDVAVGGDLDLGGGALITDPGGTVSVGGTAPTDPRIRPGGVPADPFATQLAALAALPAASSSAVSLTEPPGASAGLPCSPGTYQDVSDCRFFLPGVYVLTGGAPPPPLRSTITLKGAGTGVVLYVACSTPWWAYPVRPAPCSAGSSEQPRISFAGGSTGLTLGGHPGFAGLVLAFDPSSPAGANTNQRFSGSTGTLTLNGSVDGPAVSLRDPSPASSAKIVVNGGRVVVGTVSYGGPVPVPAHPYLTVRAPAVEPLPDGPVRLVPTP